MAFRNIVFAGVAACSLAGCATIINGTSQKYQIRSDPDGALAMLSNGQSCTARCELSLKRRYDQCVDFKREGYQPAYVLDSFSFRLKRSLSS